jgi:hypothetical protein
MSMAHAIAWIFEALLRLLLPRPARMPHVPAQPTLFRPPGVHGPAMIRPYVIAHERAERRLWRQRRRTLWLAVHGIDIGARVIHGVRVVA